MLCSRRAARCHASPGHVPQLVGSRARYSYRMSVTRSTSSQSPALHRAVPWAFVAIVMIGGLGTYFRFVSGAPFAVDTAWQAFVRLEPHSLSFVFAAFLAEVGSAAGVGVCAAIAGALLFSIRERRQASALLVACGLGVILSEATKYLVSRPRPMSALYAYTGSSYPSGHSMGAAVLAVSLACAVAALSRRPDTWVTTSNVVWASVLAGLWVAAMMWSRTALGVHWLSDAFAGAALGVAATVLAQWICAPRGQHVRAAA